MTTVKFDSAGEKVEVDLVPGHEYAMMRPDGEAGHVDQVYKGPVEGVGQTMHLLEGDGVISFLSEEALCEDVIGEV